LGIFHVKVCSKCGVEPTYAGNITDGNFSKSICPLCDDSEFIWVDNGNQTIIDRSDIPFLRFMRGKSPTPDK
jgi:hypothetical protein